MYSQTRSKDHFIHKVKTHEDDPVIQGFIEAMENLEKAIEDKNAKEGHQKRLKELKKQMDEIKSISQDEYDISSQLNETNQRIKAEIDALFQERREFYDRSYSLAILIIEGNTKKNKLEISSKSELELLTQCVKFQEHMFSGEKITSEDLKIGINIEKKFGKLEDLRKREKTAVKRKRMWLDIMDLVSIGLFVCGVMACFAGLATLPLGAGAISVAVGIALLAAGFAVVGSRKQMKINLNKKEERIRTKIKLHEFHGRLMVASDMEAEMKEKNPHIEKKQRN